MGIKVIGNSIATSSKRALVIGAGLSGSAAVGCLVDQGYEVIVADARVDRAFKDAEVISDQGDFPNKELSLVVASPGISQNHPLYVEAKRRKIPLIGEAELGFRLYAEGKRAIGVTGTNGKTTMTALVAHVLNASGLKAVSIGNIGAPVSKILKDLDRDTIIVAELSSYQLETMETRVFDEGVILNVTPDHLDRYTSMNEYASAKMRLFSCMKEEGHLYCHIDVMKEFLHGDPRVSKMRFFGPELTSHAWMDGEIISLVERLSSMLVSGKEGLLIAYQMVRSFGVSIGDFFSALQTFSKPEHRLELVGEIGGVKFYNDSKATNIASVEFALNSFDEPVILLMGGRKKTEFSPLAPKIRQKVKMLIGFGESGEEIVQEFGAIVSCCNKSTLQEAVHYSSKLAQVGDAVLLSPGGSSFDEFKNFEERGKAFKTLVQHLYLGLEEVYES